MKANRVKKCGAPEVLKLAEVPDLIPSSGQVVVKVEAAGETYIRSGSYAKKPELPYAPGSESLDFGATPPPATHESMWRAPVLLE